MAKSGSCKTKSVKRTGKSDRLQIRIAPETKARGEELFESMGLNMSKAVNLFIEQAIRDGGLPFNLSANSSVRSREF